MVLHLSTVVQKCQESTCFGEMKIGCDESRTMVQNSLFSIAVAKIWFCRDQEQLVE